MTKQTSRILKGICGFLIVCTHVFGFYASSSELFKIQIGSYVLEDVLSRICDIAVYIFAFISGYGLFKSYEGKSTKELFKGTLTKLIRFLLSYWIIVFTLFVPFYSIKNGSFNFLETFKTMFGHHGYFSYGWYVYFYILVLVTLPFVSKLFKSTWFLNIIVPLILGTVMYVVILVFGKNLQYYDITCILIFAYTITLVGCAFAKTEIFNKKFFEKNLILEIIIFVVGLLVEIVGYGLLKKGIFQVFAVILILYPLVRWMNNITENKLTKCLCFAGDNSGNIWYIHSLFSATYTVELFRIIDLFKTVKIAFFGTIIIYFASLGISTLYYFLNKKIIIKIKV